MISKIPRRFFMHGFDILGVRITKSSKRELLSRLAVFVPYLRDFLYTYGGACCVKQEGIRAVVYHILEYNYSKLITEVIKYLRLDFYMFSYGVKPHIF